MKQSQQTHTISFSPKAIVSFQSDLVLGSIHIDTLRALCAMPVEFNFRHVRLVEESVAGIFRQVFAEAAAGGNCPAFSGAEHLPLLAWALILAGAAPAQDMAYRC